MVSRKSVIKRGDAYPIPETTYLYEKTSSDDELVAGLGASKGTADRQLKIYAGGIPFAVFDYQTTHPGRYSDKDDWRYAHDGQPVNYFREPFGSAVFEGVLDDGQSLTMGAAVQFETNTGKIQALALNPRCGFAAETKAASGADSTILVLWCPRANAADVSTTVVTSETVTVSGNEGTLAHVPRSIEYVEVTAGTGIEGKLAVLTEAVTVTGHTGALAQVPAIVEYVEVVTGDGPLAFQDLEVIEDTGLAVSSHVATLTRIPVAFLYIEGKYKDTAVHAFSPQVSVVAATDLDAVQVDAANKTLTFHATDAVKTGTVNVGYLSRTVTKRTHLLVVVNDTSPAPGEVAINYSTKAVTTNATDNITALKVRYWYRLTKETGLKIVQTAAPQQGEVKVVYSTGVMTFNATDNITQVKVRYIYAA